MAKTQLVIAGTGEAARRAERRAKALGVEVVRLEKPTRGLPRANYMIDASDDAWLARVRSAFCRNDRELKAETGEAGAPEDPVAEKTPWRVMGDFIYSANDIASGLKLPDTTAAGGLPLRALYSWSVGNLFLAGTCVSCTARALDLLRAMPGVLELTGDLAACACAVGIRHGLSYHRPVFGNHLEEFLALAKEVAE